MSRKTIPQWLLALLVLAALAVGGGLRNGVEATSNIDYEQLRLFSKILDTVETSYFESVDRKKLLYGAIKGMMQTLDPHSSFMEPEEYRETQVQTRGEFGGLGIEITLLDGLLTVVSPIEGTPAFKAGIEAGDQIVGIDGKSTKGITLTEAVKKLRGKPGSKVTISVMREGLAKPNEVTITRAVIKIQSVKSKLLEGGIGYVRISQFQERTAEGLEKALSNLEDQADPFNGLVLDLRNNPGGLLDQAWKVADMFLSEGLIVYTNGRLEDQKMRFEAHPEGTHAGFPMVVLVNGGSASGSEIVAGALQDQGRAVVMGTLTFGKASVQTIIPIEDGSGLRLTTALYFTPAGRSIQATGIEPDIIVEARRLGKEENKQEAARRRMRERDLERHIENPENGEEAEPKGQKDSESEKPPAERLRKLADLENDAQLQRAVDLLRSLQIFSKSGGAKYISELKK